MKKTSTLICMLCMCMSSVLAKEILPANAMDDPAGKMAKDSQGDYLAWHVPALEIANVDAESVVLMFTDNSYDDASYSIYQRQEGSATWQLLVEFSAPDSGSVSFFDHLSLKPGTRYNYSVSVVLNNGNSMADVATTSATTTIDTPDIRYDIHYTYDCGSEIPIVTSTPTPGAYTEIYQSISATGPWALVATLPPGNENILFDVQPRQTYYYRARGTNAARDVFSGWSNVMSRYVGSDWIGMIQHST